MARDLSQMLNHVEFVVTAEEAGQRLDHFVGNRVFWRSRSDIQKRIRSRTVLVDQQTAKPSYRMQVGQTVTVQVRPEDLPDQDPSAIEVAVLFEDDDLIVVNKQAGLIVHPIGRHVYDTLMNALHLRYAEQPSVEPHVVHRLDRMTSGVLVVAKNSESKKNLQTQFESRKPEKRYQALIEGVPSRDEWTIEQPMGRDEQAAIRLKMCVRPDGQPARTDVRIDRQWGHTSLVTCELLSGRQHQIRVHLEWAGHPLLCDPLYGDPRSVGTTSQEVPVLRRQALHACELLFDHPRTDEPMGFKAPLASDMAQLVTEFERGSEPIKQQDEQSDHWKT